MRVAVFPSQGLCGGVRGGKVPGQPNGLGKATPGGWGQAAAAVDDLLVSAA
ncbi:hypothetical protein ACFRFU_47190 [Streptomyces sp. NPDC056704]|uniref:hypothetical protein n=1 Tax=Streptomyces sp. NPDC056704 TaxID=3345917 RepID=UPI0036947DF0